MYYGSPEGIPQEVKKVKNKTSGQAENKLASLRSERENIKHWNTTKHLGLYFRITITKYLDYMES